MISAADILADLEKLGVAIEARDGRLRLSPQSVIPDALAAQVKANKPDIVLRLIHLAWAKECERAPHNQKPDPRSFGPETLGG